MGEAGWTAVGAVGTWVQAILVPIAVFLAWALAEGSGRRAERVRQFSRLSTLQALYQQAGIALGGLKESASPNEHGFAPAPPLVAQFDDLLQALSAVNVLDMPSFEATNDLFAVRRAMVTARELAAKTGTDSWNDSEVQLAFTAHFKMVENARARIAAVGSAKRLKLLG